MPEGRRIKYSPRQTEIRDSVLQALNRLGCEISQDSAGYDKIKYRDSIFSVKYGDNILVVLFFTDIKPIIGHTQEYYNVFEAMNYANGHPGPNFVLAGPFKGDLYLVVARREAVIMPDTEISERFMEGFLNDFFEALRIFNIGYYFHVGDNESENEPGNERCDRQWEDLVNSLYESAEVSDLITRQEVVNPMKQEEDLPDTCGLMFRTLINIGCQPTKNEDGTITVFYQGENFYMEFYGRHAKIWDLGWTYVKADDPDLDLVIKTVNACNYNFGPTMVMSQPDENGIIYIHSCYDIRLHPECPGNNPFVRAMLNSFFGTRGIYRGKFIDLHMRQFEAQQSRHPVGFATDINDKEK